MKTKEEHLARYQKRYFFWKQFLTVLFVNSGSLLIISLIGYFSTDTLEHFPAFVPAMFIMAMFSSLTVGFTRSKTEEIKYLREKIGKLWEKISMVEKSLQEKKTAGFKFLAEMKKLCRLKNRLAKKEAYLQMLGG
jgi:uncharacterized membrane protein